MITLRRLFFDIQYPYENPQDIQRARLILPLNFIMILFWVLTLLLFVLPPLSAGEAVNPGAAGFVLILPPALIPMYYLVRTGRVNTAAWIIILLITMTSIIAPLNTLTEWQSVLIAIPIVMAGTMLSGTGFLVITLICIAAVLTGAISDQRLQTSVEFIPAQASATAGLTVLIGIITLVTILRILGRSQSDNLARLIGAQRRARTSLSRLSEKEIDQDQDALISRTLNILRDDMKMSIAQVFLADSSGKITQRLYTSIDTNHELVYEFLEDVTPIAIAEAADTLTTVRVGPMSSEVQRRHLSAGARFGVAVPLVHNGQIVGVLDVQSENDENLDITDISTLELMGQFLSRNLLQAQIITETQRNLNEQQSIILRQRSRLRELERRESQTVSEAWNTYLMQRGVELLGFDIQASDEAPTLSFDVSPDMLETMRDGEMIIEDQGDHQIVNAPIEMRGQIIGVISFRIPASQPFNNRQRDLLRNVIQRLSLALENKRLFEQTQSQAQREVQANNVGSRLLQTTDIDTLMKLAAESFNEALGAIQTQILLNPDVTSAGSNRTTEEAR